jgi:hypothetical protein
VKISSQLVPDLVTFADDPGVNALWAGEHDGAVLGKGGGGEEEEEKDNARHGIAKVQNQEVNFLSSSRIKYRACGAPLQKEETALAIAA